MSSPAIPIPAALPAEGVGHRIGRYELLSEIAVGGMGRVYKARVRGPAGFEKLVAVKTVHTELAKEPDFVEMFLDEARIAARIDHPNVCHVFDFGEADGRYFIAMEYLAGASLARVFRMMTQAERQPLDDAIVTRIVAEAAEGLHAVHELRDDRGELLQVVHRDVSPPNLFVTFTGGVRLLDFGVASARGRLHQTTAGSVKGKLTYMAPEVLRREPLDRRVDIWSLGVVLWELLARRRLIPNASELDVILSVSTEGAPSLLDVRPDTPPELARIVAKALERDPSARYATAREMGQDLQRWILAEGITLGMAEVAAFMDRFFAGERASALRPISEPPIATETRPARSHPSSGSLEIDVEVEPPIASLPPASAASPGASSRGMPITLFAIAMLVASGLAFWAGSATPPAPPATVVAVVPPPMPATTAPIQTPAPAAAPTPPPASPTPTSPGSATRAEEAPRARGERGARPRRAEEEAAGDTGELRVTTPGGWADVYVDGTRAGRSPLTLTLPRGTARVELRPFGLPPPSGDSELRRSVRIGPRPARIDVRLTP